MKTFNVTGNEPSFLEAERKLLKRLFLSQFERTPLKKIYLRLGERLS